jgi:hypothetical protein
MSRSLLSLRHMAAGRDRAKPLAARVHGLTICLAQIGVAGHGFRGPQVLIGHSTGATRTNDRPVHHHLAGN